MFTITKRTSFLWSTPFLCLLSIMPAPSYSSSWGAVSSTYYEGSSIGLIYEFSWPDQVDFTLPCQFPYCYLGVGTMAVGLGGVVNPWAAQGVVTYRNGESATTVRARWVSKYGASGTAREPHWVAKDLESRIDWDTLCVGFQYWPSSAQRGTLLPDSTCGRVPPPTKHCDALPDISFDYGTLPHASVIGATMRRTVRLSCTGVQSVSLRLMSPIQLAPGLSSEIQADGVVLSPAGSIFDVSRTGRDLVFTSTLVGTVEASYVGGLSASSVLIVEIL